MRKNYSINHFDRKLRIIGGKWRGRKISFQSKDGLRPTKDVVRETLFNWIEPYISGAKCLDLFCGTGSLGLEALSRGASYCDFVDKCRLNTKTLMFNLQTINAGNRAKVHNQLVNKFLSCSKKSYDIIFIDPPFKSNLLSQTCKTLSSNQLIEPGGSIYMEFSVTIPPDEIPLNWNIHRKKRSGSVKYCLYHQSKD